MAKRSYHTTTARYDLTQEDDLYALWHTGILVDHVENWENLGKFVSKVTDLNYVMMSAEYFNDIYYRIHSGVEFE